MTRYVQLGDTGNWIKQTFLNGVWVEIVESSRIDSSVSIEEPVLCEHGLPKNECMADVRCTICGQRRRLCNHYSR